MWSLQSLRRLSLLFGLHIFSTWAHIYSLSCKDFPCSAPYTESHGSSCGCSLSMEIKLLLNMTLESFFPLASVFTGEIADGLLLLPSQVRLQGASVDGQDEGRSIATIELVPLGKSFDNLTAIMIYERLLNHQALDSQSYFNNYTLMYLYYPGLPLLSTPSNITSGELPGAGIWPREQPLSVNVSKGSRRVTGGTLALILLSSAIAAAGCGVLLTILFRFNKVIMAFRAAEKSRYPTSDLNDFSVMHPPSTISTCTLAVRVFSIYDLEKATDNFNSDNIIGQGGYGCVYSGALEDGTEVAVKLMTRDDQRKKIEFFAELEMLSRVHHRNLVKLIGACLEVDGCCLVYELIPNGNVESHLHGKHRLMQPLDWNTRMKIALGAARGLAYLHEDANPHVIHRDFKSSNILLDRDFTPKISDFGLAKIAPDKQDGHISTSVMGTFGYVAPEYAMTGHLLVKSDVYSFGVVLLELLSGKRPIDFSQPPGEENLVNWARPLLSKEEGLQALADPSLDGRFPFDLFSKVAMIALMCVELDPSCRPFMGEVVQALKIVCGASEGVSSSSVSPQASGGTQSDLGGQVSGRKSGCLINIDSGSSCSFDFGFKAADRTIKAGQVSFSNHLSDSGYMHRHMFDSSGRHSLSGPSSSNGTGYTWSIEKDATYAPISEHRLCCNKDKTSESEACGSWP
ncbi:hypothetical protein KP509_34G043300 [Ceratopteris richardii]|uniref:Protein kinase domain-containing protein n=1 Tax=Ceratopteris richardii TaxID=49495 RepID=A0A8T2QLD7_CERRI|nr:hypothetical protein KP509_34G043300 [Ceratopteris richardii]KAH7284204.1 hypothetical protein KP509_34G043300 [Ceratopteris richardii]KAH7284205.1 hypothetical protein KP509_34G043300 [Ceratopteris richardii]KAH7284206.1 hypothetical protein KP509_34G043300 [Ceratopteris richardii]KAH7284207.1 hypothetical protein KP509_34G043300 [Ceratopteris richardii]